MSIDIVDVEIQPNDISTCNVRLDLSFVGGSSWNDFKESMVHYSNHIHHTSSISGDDATHHHIDEIKIQEVNYDNESITITNLPVEDENVWNTYSFHTILIKSDLTQYQSTTHEETIYGTLPTPDLSTDKELTNAYVLKVDISTSSVSDLSGFLFTIGGAKYINLDGVSAKDASYTEMETSGNFDSYQIQSFFVPKTDFSSNGFVERGEYYVDNSYNSTSSYYVRVCDPSYAINEISAGQVDRMVFNELKTGNQLNTENSVCLIDIRGHQSNISNTVEAHGNADIKNFEDIRAYTGDAGIVSKLPDGSDYTEHSYNSDQPSNTYIDPSMNVTYTAGVGSYGHMKVYGTKPDEMILNTPYTARIFYSQTISVGISNEVKDYLTSEYSLNAEDSSNVYLSISGDWEKEDITFSDLLNGHVISDLSDGIAVHFFIQSIVDDTFCKVRNLKDIGKITPHAPPPRIMHSNASKHGSALDASNNPLYQDTSSVHVDFTISGEYVNAKVGNLTGIMVQFEDAVDASVNKYDISNVVTNTSNVSQGNFLASTGSYRLNLDHNQGRHTDSDADIEQRTHYDSLNKTYALADDTDISLALAFTTDYFPYTLPPSDVSFSNAVYIRVRDKPAALTGVSFQGINGGVAAAGGDKGKIKITVDTPTGVSTSDLLPVQIIVEEKGGNTRINKSNVPPYSSISEITTDTSYAVFDLSLTNVSGTSRHEISFNSPYDNHEFEYQIARRLNNFYKLRAASVNDGTTTPSGITRNDNNTADLYTDLNWVSHGSAINTKHKPTNTLDVSNDAPTFGQENDISFVKFHVKETAKSPQGLGDDPSATKLVLRKITAAGGFEDFLDVALDTIPGRTANFDDASNNQEINYEVSFNVGDISSGQEYNLILKNSVGKSDVSENTGELFTRYAPEPPTLTWAAYQSETPYQTPTEVGVLQISLDNLKDSSNNYGGDPLYDPSHYNIVLNISGGASSGTLTITKNGFSGTGDLDTIYDSSGTLRSAGSSITMPASIPSTIPTLILFKDLSANEQYYFQAKLVNIEVNNYESIPDTIDADTDHTLDNYNTGDFNLNTISLTKAIQDDGVIDTNEVRLEVDISFTGSAVNVANNIGTNVHGFYIIADISDDEFIIYSEEISSNNIINYVKQFDTSNRFGNMLELPAITDISNFVVSDTRIRDIEVANGLGNQTLNYPHFGLPIIYKLRVAFKDQDDNLYNDISYQASGGGTILTAQVSEHAAVHTSFPTIENVKVTTSYNKITQFDISLSLHGEIIEEFKVLSPNDIGTNMFFDLATRDSSFNEFTAAKGSNTKLFGVHKYITGPDFSNVGLSHNTGAPRDIIFFIRNSVGANLYYLDNFIDGQYHNNSDIIHLNTLS